MSHKAGFVNIFGPPNAGKSSLLNALLGEQLAIVSPKIQTTRHRILGFLSKPDYQIIFSDTPGIIDPKYKLHSKMMQQVQHAVEDTDVALLMVDISEKNDQLSDIFGRLHLKAAKILLINKIDLIKSETERNEKIKLIEKQFQIQNAIAFSVKSGQNLDEIIPAILNLLPENPPFFPEDDLTDRPTRFFVAEFIREQVYYLYEKEIPYHTAVLIQSFEELPQITRIKADIIVTRETQKLILLGKGGSMIKKLGTQARKKMEAFLGQKVYLELFVKVRPKWRENDNYLKEYGY